MDRIDYCSDQPGLVKILLGSLFCFSHSAMSRQTASVTIHDVAREAGVSSATVSRYLNGSGPVSLAVAGRIQAVMKDLKYVPHAAARRLATRKAHAIGLLIVDMSHPYFSALVGGVESIVRQEGYDLLVATRHMQNQVDTPISLGPHNSDGMLVFPGSLRHDEILELHQAGFPLVLLYCASPEAPDIPSVVIEEQKATKRLIDHLIEVHHRRRIVLMCDPTFEGNLHMRESGYEESLVAHGIAYDPSLVIFGEVSRRTAHQAMSRFVGNGPLGFDAVFAGNDDAAIGVMSALMELGLRIPDDVCVVGFDDLAFSPLLTPSLTTVRVPTACVGRTAARHLFDLLANKRVELLTELPAEVVIRRSCGCVA